MDEVNRDDLVQKVAGLPEATGSDSDEEEKNYSEHINSVGQELTTRAVTKVTLERHASLISDILKAFT